ncbi:MAG: hypothetical protein SGJ21_04920 [Alphaproteobacteria bacterium]|nr:hypothetical protein [Alphaproteobacteria bacterium]
MTFLPKSAEISSEVLGYVIALFSLVGTGFLFVVAGGSAIIA